MRHKPRWLKDDWFSKGEIRRVGNINSPPGSTNYTEIQSVCVATIFLCDRKKDFRSAKGIRERTRGLSAGVKETSIDGKW